LLSQQLARTVASQGAARRPARPAGRTATAARAPRSYGITHSLDVICKGAKIRDGESVHVYAVVMTGRFIIHRGPPNSPPPTGSTLAVILDARMLTQWDLSLSDHDQTALLPLLGPVMTLKTP
jgi:hypothetical protein